MNTENTKASPRLVSSWRQLLFWPIGAFVIVYFTQSFWLPFAVPLVIQRARSSLASPSEKRWEWEFVRRRAVTSKNQELLQTVGSDTSAPGEVRGTAWAALAQQSQQMGDQKKAADCYLAALGCLVSDPHLSGNGYALRNEVWNQVRFELRTQIDPARYREVLLSWAEHTDDSRDHTLLEQLVFELGKTKLLASAELGGGHLEAKP
jgi:hypothetical protein